MVRPNGPRDPIAGPDTPGAPFPLKLRGPVIEGFGRGSKDLGIPTANIPLSGLSIGGNEDLSSGIYYGWCTLDHSTISSSSTNSPPNPSNTTNSSTTPSQPSPSPQVPPAPSSSHSVTDLSYPSGPTTNTILPTVLSIGFNPYYNNTERSIEIHIMHNFDSDFYGATLSLIILGFIRPEYDYVSKDALVEDIKEDIRVAGRSLEREGYQSFKGDAWLKGE